MTSRLRKDLDLFFDLVSDYIKEENSEKFKEINSVYNSLKENLPVDSVEMRAVNNLMSLVK